uniref:guanylate cyclase n=1 Tax=Otolemur garnettii TaxID=30611 RepID=H0XBF1_OTOGA
PQTIQQTLKRTLQYYEHQVIGYRDAEKNLHHISNRCSYADHSNREEMEYVSGILQCAANVLGLKFEEIQERFGEEFFNTCFEENERVLRAVGGTLQDFFNGFDALLEHIRTSFGKQASLESPSFLCRELREGTLMLHYFHPHHVVGLAMLGMIKAAGKKIYRLDVEVEQVADEKLRSDGANPGNCGCLTFLIRECENSNITKNLVRGTSQVPADLRISISTFCRAFPFHLMFDPNMSVLQLGEGLRKQLRCDTHKVLKFEDCFEIVSPKVNATFERVLLRLSTPFVIRTKPEASGTENKDKKTSHTPEGHLLPRQYSGYRDLQVMEVKGQMIHVPESNSILFLGSPCVDKLDELMGRGLHLSDIPIHDATRDVILVGEQAKAQDGLKKRMDKLKATLERTHQALEEEKKKTVDLLYSIFPGDVAQQLWQGQQVQARKFDDVTMLFSDIVGFTAICAQCTPMQVISMLNELYTRFDHQCGFLDIYKVETIGDAYCVAAGLHRKSLCHAKPIALMALKMMELSEEVLTPDGRPIQVTL